MNIAFKLAYDGSSFLGWQKTAMGASIEETLQSCIEQILQEPITLQAASRTDRGVHAEGQWVNFHTDKKPPLDNLQRGLNALLPQTIRILTIHEVPLEFHPTLHAEKKEYHYQVCQGPVQLPKERAFSWHIPQELDLKKMHTACPFFEGVHDFSSFCNFRKNLNYKDKNRNLESIEILQEGNQLLFIVKGDHFLYKMVRNIVGTLVSIGQGKIDPAELPAIIAAHSRPMAGVTAPAHGLTLKKIYYPTHFGL